MMNLTIYVPIITYGSTEADLVLGIIFLALALVLVEVLRFFFSPGRQNSTLHRR